MTVLSGANRQSVPFGYYSGFTPLTKEGEQSSQRVFTGRVFARDEKLVFLLVTTPGSPGARVTPRVNKNPLQNILMNL